MFGIFYDRNDTFSAINLLEAIFTMEKDNNIFSNKTSLILNAQIDSLLRAYSIKSVEDLSSGIFLNYSEQKVQKVIDAINTQGLKKLKLNSQEAKTVITLQKKSGELELLKTVFASFYSYLFRILKTNQNAHPFLEGSFPMVIYAGILGNTVSFAIDEKLKPIWDFLSICISPQKKEFLRSELIQNYDYPTESFWKYYVEDQADML
ncbi:hypothetical protein [Spirochaeta isovalerica]|uniref:Uncharacterized protein n=1 Tax=Spirochaeta isovalerica TaxID=150 RepID=A0A841RBC6_9SPIO|nr:hypothetical protein [Spirochaeta isovalerica]MBB6482704.1 hypothetical protein [Spirochaeta isovalerica]